MKPWREPMFQTQCYICGRLGWNLRAMESWLGAQFRCADGCDPRDVAEHQTEKVIRKMESLTKAKEAQQPEYVI